jgi:hypothetical protein
MRRLSHLGEFEIDRREHAHRSMISNSTGFCEKTSFFKPSVIEERPMSVSIFVSYRRDDTAATAGRLRDRLALEFGTKNVFMDVDNIPAGVDFAKHLQVQLANCDLVVALIGAQWLTIANAFGTPRIQDPDDYVRMELSAALSSGLTLVPVLVDGASMPAEARLPVPLQPLSKLNAIELRNSQFRWDSTRVVEKLSETLGYSLRRRLKWLAGAAACAMAVITTCAIKFGWLGLTPRSMWTPAGFAPEDYSGCGQSGTSSVRHWQFATHRAGADQPERYGQSSATERIYG